MSGFFCMKPFLLEGIVVLRLFCPSLNKDQSHISIWHIWWDRWTIIHFCPFSFHHHLIHLFQQRRLTPGSVIKPDRPNGMFTNSTELISHTLGPFKKKKKKQTKNWWVIEQIFFSPSVEQWDISEDFLPCLRSNTECVTTSAASRDVPMCSKASQEGSKTYPAIRCSAFHEEMSNPSIHTAGCPYL